MAGASMNDIKARIKSVSGTMQITKAMELVAISKLRRAKENVESSRPFFTVLKGAIEQLRSSRDAQDTVWRTPKEVGKTLFVVIAGDRGLAGGYNSNVFKYAASLKDSADAVYLPVGKKSYDYYRYRSESLYSAAFTEVGDVSVSDSYAMARIITEGYVKGEFDKVVLVYTRFVSMMSQSVAHEQILPLSEVEAKSSEQSDPIFEGEVDEILARIIPQYVGGIVYSAVCESLASEFSARRMSMNAANKNAQEMIDSLMLGYNRARQAVITQEITEIVSGAEAL